MEIKLKHGVIVLLDEIDAPVLQWQWFAEVRASKVGHHNIVIKRWIRREQAKTTTYLNRVIYERAHGKIPDGAMVSMKVFPSRKKTLDFRRENLELGTGTSVLSGVRKNHNRKTTSKYKGVYMSRGGKWLAQIGFKGGKYYVGTFADEADAAQAYDQKAIDFDPDYKVLNFEENRAIYLAGR